MAISARPKFALFALWLGLSLASAGETHGQAVTGAVAENVEAPNVVGMAAQGISVDLEYFRGDKNVLLVFYRMYN